MERIEAWLGGKLGQEVLKLQPISGGFWSSAFVFEAQGEELVLRLSKMRDGFDTDAAAFVVAGSVLPVPQVLEIGEAFDGYFAISRRHHGRFIETTPIEDSEGVGTALGSLLKKLRSMPSSRAEPVQWFDPNASRGLAWQEWLLSGLVDDPAKQVSGWRERLGADVRADGLFRTCQSAIEELLPLCPERRDLIHGDLLHQNVLVSAEDASRITAIFSWKCSVRGDFLFDVAWCTHWGPWLPTIGSADLWRRTLEAPDLEPADLEHAPERHHCYELQIAATHLAWYAWTHDPENLVRLMDATEGILSRGPLAA